MSAAATRAPRAGLRRAGLAAAALAALAVLLGWLERKPLQAALQEARAFPGLVRVESHAAEIRAAAREQGLDPCFMAGVCWAESRGRLDALSTADALGLFQLQEGSARDAARKLGLEPPTRAELLSDAALNARLAAVHLAWLFEHEGPDPVRVLVAYNAGRTKLLRWIREDGGFEAWRARQEREGDSQVLAYARAVLEVAERFRERGVIDGR